MQHLMKWQLHILHRETGVTPNKSQNVPWPSNPRVAHWKGVQGTLSAQFSLFLLQFSEILDLAFSRYHLNLKEIPERDCDTTYQFKKKKKSGKIAVHLLPVDTWCYIY